MTTWLHEERLTAVVTAVRAAPHARVLDLGCGDGDVLLRLAREPGVTRLVGVEIDATALERLRTRLAAQDIPPPELRHASLTDPAPDLAGFDAALLVEVMEHLPPDRLSQLELALFGRLRPARVILTTPNADFNPLLGVPAHRFRHPGHRFEWPRARFRDWSRRTAARWGLAVAVQDIGGAHPDLGGASQMAVFTRG